MSRRDKSDITKWKSSDNERTKLASQLGKLKDTHEKQKEKLKKTEDKVKKQDGEIRDQKTQITELEKEKSRLEKKNDKLIDQIERLKEKLFKRSKHNKAELRKKQEEEREEEGSNNVGEEEKSEDLETRISVKTRRGAKRGHRGKGRQKPRNPDEIKRVYYTHCPDCEQELNRSKGFYSRTVEDIPPVEVMRLKVTEYEIERQWCGNCQREVTANKENKIFKLLSNSCLGINLLTQILVMRYHARMPIGIIKSYLADIHQIEVSEGGIINQLKKAKRYLEKSYEEILSEINDARVKHADETSWWVYGINNYLWAFTTEESVYIRIEDNRGKEVASNILSGSSGADIVVRDDYVGYKSLEMKHQSCWAHLLRFSKELTEESNPSEEVKALHKELKDIFCELKVVTERPFDLIDRRKSYTVFWGKIKRIIHEKYICPKAKKIQTRINNQGANLLTAVMHEGVPLTNNLAERRIRPSVVIRKISGSSQSWDGADCHAVNMSVYQTILAKNLPIYSSLQNKLISGAFGKT
jgi:transposase